MSSEQLNLALASSEKMDLCYAFPWELSLSSMAASNQIVPLNDLLAEHGTDTLSAISKDWGIMGARPGGVTFQTDRGIQREKGKRQQVIPCNNSI